MAEGKPGFVSVHDRMTPSELKELARKYLGETEELKENCLSELRVLVRENKVTCIPTDDFLLRFLRTKKFDVRKSFGALKNYVYQRKLLHKSLLQLRPEVLETCIRLNIVGLLPYRDGEGRRIFFFRVGTWNPDICSAEDMITVYLLQADYTAADENAQISGYASIYDFRSVPSTTVLHIILVINRLKNFIFNCLPARYTSVHFIGSSIFTKFLAPIILPVVPKKIAERIIFHEEAGSSLLEHFPPSILPDVFGGTCGPMDNKHLTEIMVDYFRKVKEE